MIEKPLTVKEVAEAANCSVASIYRAIDRGALKCFRCAGSKQGGIRITPEALKQYMSGEVATIDGDMGGRSETQEINPWQKSKLGKAHRTTTRGSRTNTANGLENVLSLPFKEAMKVVAKRRT